ncbi:MAG: TolC family protein [Candidatus Omnitrophica bacterium]|nr:TolC family protein [Candidatus Omnitrophota bacterium]
MADIFKRNTLKVIIIALSVFTAFSAFCEEPKTKEPDALSLEDAVSLAFKNNRDILIQENEIKAAQAGILDARSAFLPKLNVNAGYTRNGAILSVPAAQNTKKDIGVFTGYKNDNIVGMEMTQEIYNGGKNTANLRQKEVGLRISEQTLSAAKLQVEFETKRLFYGLLLAYETERIAASLVGQAKSHYDDVLKKYEEGTSSRFDLLQSKVQLSKLYPELIKAKNAVNLISAELKKLLGLKIDGPVVLKGKLEYCPVAIKEGEFLKSAYLNKPEMMLELLGVDLNSWNIQTAKAGGRPQVTSSLGYSYRSNDLGDMFNARHNNWSAGFSVNIPVFDGFSTKAKVDAAKARYAQAVLSRDNLTEQIAVDIRKACLDLKQAEAIIDSQKDNIGEAKEALKIAEVSYDNGEGTNLEVLDAEVSLSQVEKNLSEGIYDYLMAKAYLERTTGKLFSREAWDEKKD